MYGSLILILLKNCVAVPGKEIFVQLHLIWLSLRSKPAKWQTMQVPIKQVDNHARGNPCKWQTMQGANHTKYKHYKLPIITWKTMLVPIMQVFNHARSKQCTCNPCKWQTLQVANHENGKLCKCQTIHVCVTNAYCSYNYVYSICMLYTTQIMTHEHLYISSYLKYILGF